MANFPVNIDVNVNGSEKVRVLTESLLQIQQTSKTSAESLKMVAEALGSIKGGNGLQKIATELGKIQKQSTETASAVSKIDFRKINSSAGTLKSIDTTLKNLLKTVETLKSNSNIHLNITSNANQVQSQLQGLNRTSGNVRSHMYRTGSRNGSNYYGWNADRDLMYQKAAPITSAGRGIQRMAEKTNLIGANLMMAGTFLGFKELSDTIIETPAKAETQKYLLQNMQGGQTIHVEGGSGATSLYKTLDNVTDQLPISMQNVVQPLYAFKAASGATAQEINDIIPEFANFGAQVINMTGSEDQAEEAMQKLSRAYQGQYAAVDQYGITKESLEKVGYQEGGTIEEFMAAVTKVTGDAKQSMNNFNGLKALVGKDFSRAGKQIWSSGVGQAMNSLVGAFHSLDSSTGGFSTQLLVAGAGLLNLGTSATLILGSLGTTIGTFGQIAGNIKAIRNTGGGFRSAIKGIFSGVNQAGIYGAGGAVAGLGGEVIDNAGMEAAVFEGAYSGVSSGLGGSTLLNGKSTNVEAPRSVSPKPGVAGYPIKGGKDAVIPAAYPFATYKGVGGKTGSELAIENVEKGRQLKTNRKRYPKAYEKVEQKHLQSNASRMFKLWDTAEVQAQRNAKKSNRVANFWDMDPNTPKQLTRRQRLHQKLDKGTGWLTKKFGGLSDRISGLLNPTTGFLAVGAGLLAFKGALSIAAAHSDKAADAQKNLNRSLDLAGNAVLNGLGNIFNSLGLTDSKGLSGFADGIANATNTLSEVLNDYTGNSVADNQLNKYQKDDIERYNKGEYDFKTSYEKNFANANYTMNKNGTVTPDTQFDAEKVEAMHNQRWFGHVAETYGKIFDWIGIFGKGWEQSAKTKNLQQEALIKSGDIDTISKNQGSAFLQTFFGFGGSPFELTGESKNEVEWAKQNSENYSNINDIKKMMDSGISIKSDDGMKLSRTSDLDENNNLKPESERGSWWDNLWNFASKDVGGSVKGKTNEPQPVEIVNTGKGQGQGQGGLEGMWNSIVSFFSGGKNVGGAVQQAQGGQTQLGQGQTNPLGNLGQNFDATSIVTNIQQQLSTADFSSVGTSISTSINNALMMADTGGIQQAATNLVNSLTTGFSTAMNGASFDLSGLTSSLQAQEGQFSSAGSSGGGKYKSGFSSGVSGTSGVAQGEADAVVAALQSSVAGARAAGEAAGTAYHEGFQSKADVHSPGIAARMALGEANYLVSFLESGIAGAGRAGAMTASAYTSGVSALTGRGASNLNVAESISSTLNSATSGIPSLSTPTTPEEPSTPKNNDGNVINVDFHIDKVDSKERVKEIAETLVHIMTFNNETAGRNTSVGL